MRRLLLVRHAPTAATRAAAFGADEPLDERGRAAAALLGSELPKGGWDVVRSPALRCRQTAEAAGLGVARVDAAIAECDFGDWAGLALADIDERDAGSWMADPDARPHGGESLTAFAARVGGWLDAQGRRDGRTIAVTHAGVIRAALVHALGAPLDAFWRIDAAPLSITELHAHDGRWTVTRLNHVAAA